ncbi:MAG: type II secretion system F family protein [Geodermatophilaceae bacterium]|nr:type II secretion system F family protein [Geodermatophilaceae bacterium]
MPTQTATQTQYAYKVRDRTGKIVTGKVEAESEAAVSRRLRDMGGVPLEIAKTNAGLQREIKIGLPARVKLKDLAVFARMFATMITSGLTLMSSLAILADQSENPEMRKTLRLLKQDVEAGASLSESMAKYPKVFPAIMMNMTKAGETGGFLDSAMREVADAFEAEVRLKGKIKAALTYPVVVFILAILMCVAMLIFVVPVFESMFANLGGELPLPTQILVWMSESLRTTIPIFIVLLVVAVVLWRKYSHHRRVRAVMDPLKLKLPVFGILFKKIALARFARNFSTLLSSGVPILQCLDTVAETTGSVVISRALADVSESVSQGESLSGPLAQHDVFPPMVVKMMAVGEDTGALAPMLSKIAEFYDQEVEAATEALTALIEPLMIAFLGAIVGSMIVALYLPIFKVFDLIQ